jgi:hypothetical protein
MKSQENEQFLKVFKISALIQTTIILDTLSGL